MEIFTYSLCSTLCDKVFTISNNTMYIKFIIVGALVYKVQYYIKINRKLDFIELNFLHKD